MEEYREEFERNIEKRGDCWHWIGSGGNRNVPQIHIGEGRYISARRVSWVLHGGLRCERSFFNKCRNPACVNPDHLSPRDCDDIRDEDTYGERLRKGQQMLDGGYDGELEGLDLVEIERSLPPVKPFMRDSQYS